MSFAVDSVTGVDVSLAVAGPGAFADVDTPEDATSLGIELPGLA